MLIGRRAAIKVLHRERGAQRENVERFFNEARATSAVEDPGIVHIYDFGITTNDTAYLVMEYLDGESLSVRLRRRGPLPSHDAVRITRQIASSLAAAHAVNIVHRDLKPENLFMVRDGEAVGGERPKILDFGIAKLGDDGLDRFQTRTGAVMGTPAYMSPEQCNAGKIDPRTDIYSLGCVLFHLLTGRPPFDLEGVGAIIAAHLREPAPVPSATSTRVPAILDPLVARCLAKNPDDRFATMLELQQACDAVLGQLPSGPAITGPDVAVAHAIHREDAVTTLGTSVGQTSGEVAPMRRGVRFAVAAAAIVAGIGLAVTTRPTANVADSSRAAAPAPTMTVTPIAVPEAGSAVTPPAVVAPPAAITPPTTPAVPATPPRKAPVKKPKPARDVYEDRT
jgi:serine/threonine-protein kinase